MSRAADDAGALAAAARACARALVAGLPVPDAVGLAADAADDRIAPLLRDVGLRLRAGVPPVRAAAALAAVDGGDLVGAALAVHHEVGGDLAAALRGIATSLDARAAAAREIAAATAQARATARGAAALPAIALGLTGAAAPGTLRPLVTTAPGLAAVAVGSALVAAGLRLAGALR